MSNLNAIMQTQSQVISQAMSRASGYANRISNFIPELNVGGAKLIHNVRQPGMSKPQSLSDWIPEDERSGNMRLLDSAADKWVSKYFPELSGCLKSKPEEWLCKIIGGDDPYADSEIVFNAVWHQARDQAYRERDSVQAQVRADFSVRGFTLPPGAMIGAMMIAEEAASNSIGQVMTEEMKRQVEVKLDLLKFAEEQAITLKLGIVRSLADFYRQWVNLPERGLELAKTKASLYSTLQSALSDYHRVELGFEQLRLEAAKGKADIQVQNDRSKTAVNVRNEAAPALATAARAFGDVAAAAASSQAALVADLMAGE